MKTYSLMLPAGLLLLAAVALVRWAASLESFPAIVRIYPYIVLAGGVLLGGRFNRSRLVFAVVVLSLAERALLHFVAGSGNEESVGPIIFNSISFLLPINLVAISFLTERGLLVRWLTLGLLLLQLFTVEWLCRPQQFELAGLLEHNLVDVQFSTWTAIPQLALLVFIGAFAALTIRFLYRRNAFESGFVWALLAAFLGLTTWGKGEATTVYLATAGLILILSVIETSHTMAYEDELTGLPGRRALNESLRQLHSVYAVAMVDVDCFKKINDEYGHGVGDQVLRMVAAKLADVSGGGRVFRYGGEEFTLIFPAKSVEEALPHLGDVRRAIEASSFSLRGCDRPRKKPKHLRANHSAPQEISVTVSIGVAARDNRHTKPDEVIQAADQALYRAKATGRNLVRTQPP